MPLSLSLCIKVLIKLGLEKMFIARFEQKYQCQPGSNLLSSDLSETEIAQFYISFSKILPNSAGRPAVIAWRRSWVQTVDVCGRDLVGAK